MIRRLILFGFLLFAVAALLLIGGVIDVGMFRWPVKTLRDRDRQRVRLTPVQTTIAALTCVARPPDAAFRGRSRIAPEELTVYRVRAKLRRVLYGSDGDIHLLLADPDDPSRTLIAEIPQPIYALGSGLEGTFRSERSLVQKHLRPRGELVDVTGVGFFDYYTPTPPGRTPSNGLELHPVLSLEFPPALTPGPALPPSADRPLR